jgi:hypothetical protein
MRIDVDLSIDEPTPTFAAGTPPLLFEGPLSPI